MSRRFYPTLGAVRDLPWILLYTITFGLQLLAGFIRGLVFYVPLWAVVAITGHSMNSFAANLALYGLIFAPLVWSLTALVYPLGAGRAWQISSGGRAPSERERELVDDAINDIQANNPGVRAPRRWFVLDEWDFNAAIFGDAMMITAGLLDHDALTAVIAHELGHLNSTDSHLSVAVTRLGSPARLLVPVRNAMIGDEGGGCLLAPLIGLVGLASGYALLRLVGPLWDAWWR
jgi:Zn-dependent protease with chaperone function